jgi:hypothetical protein
MSRNPSTNASAHGYLINIRKKMLGLAALSDDCRSEAARSLHDVRAHELLLMGSGDIPMHVIVLDKHGAVVGRPGRCVYPDQFLQEDTLYFNRVAGDYTTRDEMTVIERMTKEEFLTAYRLIPV